MNRKANAYNAKANGRCNKTDAKSSCQPMPMIAPTPAVQAPVPVQQAAPAQDQSCLVEATQAGAAMAGQAIQ